MVEFGDLGFREVMNSNGDRHEPLSVVDQLVDQGLLATSELDNLEHKGEYFNRHSRDQHAPLPHYVFVVR